MPTRQQGFPEGQIAQVLCEVWMEDSEAITLEGTSYQKEATEESIRSKEATGLRYTMDGAGLHEETPGLQRPVDPLRGEVSSY